MKVVVLAAGFGTRLYPLTDSCAKPLLNVGGMSVLSRILQSVRRIPGLRSLTVVCNGKFHQDFLRWQESEPVWPPMRIISDGALDNDHRLGALRDLELGLLAEEETATDPREPVLVVGGDNVFFLDLCEVAAAFRSHPSDPLLLLRRVPEPVPPGRYSEVLLDAGGRVARFREKPTSPESALSAICLYFFPSALLGWLAEYGACGGNPDAPGHFLAWLSERTTLRAYPLPEPFFDIGDAATLLAARQHFEGTLKDGE